MEALDTCKCRLETRFCSLSNSITGYQPTLTVYGRPHIQPRSLAAYVVDPSLPAPKYSNHKVILHHPYPPLLQHIQDFISHILGVGFDHVMLNRYTSGSVGIGKHRDAKENQVIAVLSLGAERTFVMTPQVSSRGVPKVSCGDRKWTLGNGSLLVMQGDTQKNWKVCNSVFIHTGLALIPMIYSMKFRKRRRFETDEFR